MNLQQLKSLSDSLADDQEFLAHPAVRRAYWKCVGHPDEGHEWYTWPDKRCCRKCNEKPATGARHRDACEIPGSLADATEVLREIVVNRLEIDLNGGCAVPRSLLELKPLDTPRDRFVIFAAAAGGGGDWGNPMSEQMGFDAWYARYETICKEHDWPVPDQSCMMDAFSDGMSPEEAFETEVSYADE